MHSLPARRIATIAAVAASTVVAVAVPAFAHVSVQPGTATQGAYTAVAFRVPDESDTASTVKVEVSLPTDHPIASVMTQPLPGWTATVEKTKLDKPIKTDDGDQITDAVSKITWTPDAGTKIAPGQFQEFKVSLGPLPTDTDKLTFKALQTYDDGNVVRWIEEPKEGQPEPAHPAPTLTLVKAPATTQNSAASASASAKSDDSTARTLGVVGIVVGVIGTALGVVGLRRKTGGNAS